MNAMIEDYYKPVNPISKKERKKRKIGNNFIKKSAQKGLKWLAKRGDVAQLIVTSPPYYRCRNFNVKDNCKKIKSRDADAPKKSERRGEAIPAADIDNEILGSEDTPFLFARNLANVFGEVDEASWLAEDGSIFVVLGDTIARRNFNDPRNVYPSIFKKDMIGINHLFTLEMRRLGWRFHQEIIWSKTTPPPSGACQTRCKPSKDYILWFSKSEKPAFDRKCIQEDAITPAGKVYKKKTNSTKIKYTGSFSQLLVTNGKRNRSDVWMIRSCHNTTAHVAPYPEEIPKLCIKACTQPGDLVCDPFCGSGTTMTIARRFRRRSIGFDLIKYGWQ